MTILRLNPRFVERVWGSESASSLFPASPPGSIGEVWYEHACAPDPELLVKYLLTTERLSVQVHPPAGEETGLPRGKDEAWLILDAAPGSVVGIGLNQEVTKQQLASAALDGSIIDLLNWVEVSPGDIYFSPAGTVHAIGAGLTLIEVQENLDLTYRLYDYGRGRKLHLDEALAIADRKPLSPSSVRFDTGPGRHELLSTPHFDLGCWRGAEASGTLSRLDGPSWFIALAGEASIGGRRMEKGDVWLVHEQSEFDLNRDAIILVSTARRP